jgi:hypothetical protein
MNALTMKNLSRSTSNDTKIARLTGSSYMEMNLSRQFKDKVASSAATFSPRRLAVAYRSSCTGTWPRSPKSPPLI